MTTTTSALADPIKFSARAVLQTVLEHLRPREFAVELWDGEQWPPEPNGLSHRRPPLKVNTG
jgi:hypothetical protein